MNSGCINRKRVMICAAPWTGRKAIHQEIPTPRWFFKSLKKMPDKQDSENVRLDLNNEVFLRQWLEMDKADRVRVTDTFRKLLKLTWADIYRDQGLKWEKVTSIRPPAGVDALYTLRIAQSRRATAWRQGNFMRLLSIAPDHDAAYGKK